MGNASIATLEYWNLEVLAGSRAGEAIWRQCADISNNTEATHRLRLRQVKGGCAAASAEPGWQ